MQSSDLYRHMPDRELAKGATEEERRRLNFRLFARKPSHCRHLSISTLGIFFFRHVLKKSLLILRKENEFKEVGETRGADCKMDQEQEDKDGPCQGGAPKPKRASPRAANYAIEYSRCGIGLGTQMDELFETLLSSLLPYKFSKLAARYEQLFPKITLDNCT